MAAESRVVRRFRSTSPEATESLGEALGRSLTAAGAVVALNGELGAGKTTLVRGLARGLGVRQPITSPTFALMHEALGRLPFFHFDAWMAGRESAFLEGGGADYLGGEGVAVVEWADRIAGLLPSPRLEVRLSHLAPDERRLELAIVPAALGSGPRAGALQTALEALLSRIEAAPGLDPVSPVSRGDSPGSQNGNER